MNRIQFTSTLLAAAALTLAVGCGLRVRAATNCELSKKNSSGAGCVMR